MKELEDREREKESKNIDSSKTRPALQLEGKIQSSTQPALQPACRGQFSNQPALQPVGRVQSFDQLAGSAENNDKIYGMVRRARKTVGFSPITSTNIKEVMEDMSIKNMEAGKEEAVKDFFR